MRRLERDEARRIAVRAQMLDDDRPHDLSTAVERLTFLQLDPTAAIVPNADLVLWTRLGDSYRPEHLVQATEGDRVLFEHRAQPAVAEPVIAMLRPMEHLGLHLADMQAWPRTTGQHSEWMTANEGFRTRVLDQLRASGPLASRDIADSADATWVSTGWTNDRNVTQMLEFLASTGSVAVSARRGKQRVWDLAERIFPPDVSVVAEEDAHRRRDELWLRSLGVARPRAVGDAGIPVEIDGTVGEWRLDPDATAAAFAGRTALLSPFDRLVHDRTRALELFDFEYTLEMYKPKDKRRWGYFALPVLHHDRLIGKVDAIADRKATVLRVHAIHRDVAFTKPISKAVDAELASLANWLGMDLEITPAI